MMDDDIQPILTNPYSNTQVTLDNIPKMATLEYARLERNLLKTSIIATVIFYSVLGIILGVLNYFDVDWVIVFFPWVVVALLFLMVLSCVLSYYSYFHKSYALREKDIIYNRGLFWKSSTVIPFNRVQHCEVSQGPIDRMFKLSELKIYTAGGSSSDLSIEGLSPENAQRIKDHIVSKTGMIDEEE